MDDATKRMMRWGPAEPTDADLDAAAQGVLDLMRTVAGAYPSADIPHIGYERYIEQPRRQGRDPMWEAMLAEAHQQSTTAAEAA